MLVRALLPLLFAGALAACTAHRPPPVEAPATAPEPTATAPAAEPSRDLVSATYHGLCIPEVGCVHICVLRDGRLVDVDAIYNSTTGDTTAATSGQPFSRAFPTDSTYAEDAEWYLTSAPVTVLGGMYTKYGLPRILGATDVVPVAAFRGVAVFAEPAANPRRPEVVYIPVRPGCEFQTYTPLAKM